MLAPLAWMVSGKAIALFALAISRVGLLDATPSRQRWDKLCRAMTVTFSQELAAGANAATPPPRISRRVPALTVVLIVLGAMALVLAGNEFWTTEVLRRPVNPVARFVTFLDLALMMTLLAVVRFIGAAANRHPRWQRAYGVLLVVFAGYLLVQAIQMQ